MIVKSQITRTEDLSFQQQRVRALYGEELLLIIQKIARFDHENSSYLLSVSFSKLEVSKKNSKISVYLDVDDQQGNLQKVLELLNKKYLSFIKRELGNSKKFRRIPAIFFLEDKLLNEERRIERIAKEIIDRQK